jgi:hypothetical protein
MKQRKVAISLAVVGAIAAPFVLQTYDMYPISSVLIPFSESEKEHRAAYLKETNNCQTLKDRIDQLRQTDPSEFLGPAWESVKSSVKGIGELEKSIAINRAIEVRGDCEINKEEFERGGLYQQSFDTFKYLLFNTMAASAGFVIVFGLAYLLPTIARRYWRWLNT